jgi:hypothetical protein
MSVREPPDGDHMKTRPSKASRGQGAVGLSALALVILFLTTCNIFKTGLGPKVDVTPPELAITSPAPGSYQHGAVVLTGTAADDIGVTSLAVDYPAAGGGTVEKSIALSGKAWTISLASGVAGGLAEGKDTITVTAKAASGKSTTASLLTYVDNIAPTVLVTTPTTFGSPFPIYSSYVDINGQAYDASPVTSVSVTLSYVSGGLPKTVTQTANGTNAWSVRFNLSQAVGGPLGLADDGAIISYSVVVTDQAGNASTYYYHAQDIYGLLSAGKLFPTVLELGQLDQGGPSPSTPTGIFFGPLSAKRIANTAPVRGDLKFSYSFTPTIQYSNLDPANPSSNVLAPGSVIVGNVIPPANAGAVDPNSLIFKIYTQAAFAAAGSPIITLTAATPYGSQLVLTNLGSSQSFRVALQDASAANLAPGLYVLDVTATAQGSGTAHDDQSFGVDSSAPTLTETTIGNNLALLHAPFSMMGLAASLSGLSTLLVEESADGGVTWSSAYSKSYGAGVVTDNWSTPASLPNAGTDGSYTYRLTLTTVSGLKAIVYRSIIYDKTPPTVTVTSPLPGSWTSASSPSISGVASDGSGSGVSSVYYLADSAANDHTSEITTWAASASTAAPTGAWTKAGGIVSNWTGSITLPGEGYNRLWVVAVDQAGNHDTVALTAATSLAAGKTYTIDTLGTTDFTTVGAASNIIGLTFTATGTGAGTGTAWTGTGQAVTIGLDLSPPNLAVAGVPATLSAATGASFTGFSGTVYDSDPARTAALVVSTTRNGAAVATNLPIAYPGTSTSSGNPWSWAFAVDTVGHTTDGQWTFTFTATDVSGKVATATRSIDIDTTAPAVTLAAVPAWVSSSSYTASGSANDPGSGASGIAAVQYKLDAGAWLNATWTDGSGGANTSGTWSQALSSLPEGTHTLAVRATDGAGNTTTLGAATFGVDLAPPNLAVAAVPAVLTAATGAAFTGFSGTIYDTNPAGLPALTVTSTQNGTAVVSNAPIGYPGTSTSSGNPWSWAFAVDTAGHTTDGQWAFTFMATDAAGKVTTVVKTITIDTAAPTTTVTSPSSGGWVSTTSLSVTGVATDGTGTGVNDVYVKVDGVYVASSPTDHSAEDPTILANGWTLATGKTSWSASLTLSGEGRKTLWIKAADVAGNVTAAAAAVTGRVDFGLDLNPPTLGFTDAVGTLVSAAFSLAGTTTDTNPAGPPTLAVTVDGGASQPVTVTAGTWSYAVTVDTSGHTNDGTHTYVFTSTDVAGKTTTLSRTITIDTTPPTTTITQPGNYTSAQSQYWLSGPTASLGGSASDPGAAASGVSRVYYKVDALGNNHGADNPVGAGWPLAAGTTTWTATADLLGLGEGQFTLWIAAYDNAGNLSSITSRSFGVDQGPPTLTETNHAATSSTKSAYTLAGAVGDTNALASLAVTESKDAGAPASVGFTSAPASLAGVKSATYTSVSLPLGGVVDGSYAYVLTATDVAGKITTVNRTIDIDTTPPTVTLNAIPGWISSAAYTISGTGTDPNAGASGVAVIQFQLDGGAWTAATWTDTSGGANTSGTWSATLSGLAEGNHALVVRGTDAASNTTTLGAASFGVDLNPPTLSESTLGTTSQVTRNGAFVMSGSVADTNPVSVAGTTLTVSVSVNGGAAVAASIVGSAWSYSQAKVDGTYSYLVTATDVSGKTTTLNRLVLLDSTPPALGVNSPSPAAGSWVSSTVLSLGGTSNDGAGSGVKKIFYLVDSAANDHTSDIAAWNLTSGASAPSSGTSASWTATAGLPDLWTGSGTLSAEGSYELWIVAADNAGNTTTLSRVPAGSLAGGTVYRIAAIGTTDFTTVGAASNTVGLSFTAAGSAAGNGTAWTGTGVGVAFGLDQSPPALAETAVNTTSTVIRNAPVSFTGTASDTNALAAAHSLTVSVDGGAAVDVGVIAGAWTFTFAVNGVTHAQDGTHTFLFTATDVAGKTAALSRSILVDTTPPSAAVTSPAAASWTATSPFTAAGTASDAAGAGVSQVWTIVDAAASSHAADSPATITSGGQWKLATGTTSWSYAWALPPEGSKTLWVAVLDAAGNWTTTYVSVSFGYDATPPALAINALGGFRTAPTITGTATDAASGIAALQYKIDAGGFSPVTVAASWSAAVSGAAFSALSEGTHTVTVQAADAAGNQSTQAATFSKDTTPPTLTYSNISTGGGTVVQDTNPVVTGTLTDVSGVSSGSYTLKVWSYSTQSWSTIASSASLGSPAGATSWTWSLDLSATGLALPDGKYQVSIGADDVPGNSIASPLVVPFLISRSNPGAAIAAPTLGTFQDAAFPVAGTVSDPNGITQVKAKIAAGAVDFSSGTTAALPALSFTVAVGTPGVLSTPAAHGLNVGDQVYLWGTPMPVTPAGSLQTGTIYYVQSVPSSTSFTISATSGGAALAINTSTASNMVVGIPKDSFSTFFPVIPVTVSGSTMTAASHGLANGEIVFFQGTALPTPANAATAYYVVNATANTFQVSTTSGGSVFSLSTTGLAVSVYSPAHPVSWMIPALSVGGFSDGALTAYVQASAGSGKVSQTSRDFTLDTTAPTISVTGPVSGTRLVGNLTINGTTADNGAIPSGVTGTIQYQIGIGFNLGNPSSWTSANVSGGAYAWSISLGDMSAYANATFAIQCDSSGNPASGTNLWKLPVVYQAVDKAGNTGQLTSYYLILDPNGNLPVVTVTQPVTGLTFGGQQRITGTATQPVAIYGVEVAVDPTGGSNFPAAPVSVAISGTTLSKTGQPFTNGMMVFLQGTTAPQIGGIPVSPTTGYWVVGAAANSFQVAASSGGSPVTFSAAGSGVTAYVWAPATLTSTGNNVTWYYDINTTNAYPQGGANSQTVGVQARAWNATSLGGPKGTLSGALSSPLIMTFNSSFPQVQNILVNGQSYFAQITTRGTISLTATVSSSKGIAKIESVEGSPLTGSTTLYNTATSYGFTSASNGSYWSATVTPPAALTTDTFSAGHLPKVLITATGSGGDAAQLIAAGAPSSSPGTVFTPTSGTSLNLASGSFFESNGSGDFTYAVAMTIASTQLYSNTTGQYAFTIRATDVTSPVAEVSAQPITLNEDNFYPTSFPTSAAFLSPAAVSAGSFQPGIRYMILAVGTTDFTAVGATASTVGLTFVATGSGSGTGAAIPVLTGTGFKVQGSSTDTGTGSGPISGLNKIIVYITNSAGTQVLDIKNGGGASAGALSLTAMDMANSGVIGPVPYPDTTAYSNYFASIDTLGSTSTNGFPDSYVIDGSARDWWVQLDTTKLIDGPVTVHYVTWDQAGNATHYAQSSFVSNHAPSLSSVVIGTDLTGAGSINATQTFSSGYGATNFTGRNKLLSFTFNSVYGGGNGALRYSLVYAGHDYLNPSAQAGVTVSGVTTSSETVTLNFTSLSPAIPDSSGSNGAAFTFSVTDLTPGSNQSYAQSVSLNIHNNDTSPPTIAVAPFGQLYSTPVDAANGGVYTDTGKALGAVAAYGANVGAGGGHVEYTSPITGGASGVSGQVVFKGKAWNDESLQKITVTIPGFNGGSGAGAEFNVATYSAGTLNGLSGAGWSFAPDTSSQSLSLADGHVLNWSFTWDSSQIATVAARNVTVTFKAYNNGTPSLSASAAMVVDILPYVTSVTTALSNAYSSNPSVFNRSAQGVYPIATTGTAVLAGFNLYLAGQTTVTLNGSSAFVAISSPSTTSLTLTLSAGATSGPLALTVNTVAADNNINSNTASMTTSASQTVFYNQVPNGVNNPLLTDDLGFSVWSFATVVTGTNSIRYPSMRVSSGGRVGFAYDFGSQEVHVNDAGTDTKVDGSFTQWYDTGFAYDGSGHFYAVGVNGDSGGTGTGSWNNTANTGFYAWQAGNATVDGSGGTYTQGTWKVLIESAYNGTTFNSQRIQQPKIAATGAVSPYNVYMTYYDASQNQLTYRWGTVATGGTFAGNLGNHPNATPGSAAGFQTMATGASTYGVGLYSAIGVSRQGYAVAVWYDQANQRLVYSYNTNPTGASQAQWQANASVLDSSFAGWFADMVVDGAGGIHIAYYNSSSGDLKYAYLSDYNTAPQIVTVDSFLSTGTDVGISVQQVGANWVPYISYYMPTFTQTSFSVRTAWRTNFTSLLPGAAADQYTGNWEIMTVPAASYPQDFRVGIGIKANASAVNTPILGYSTKNGSTYTLETAQLQ